MATIAGLTVRLVADTQQWVRETNRAAAQSRRLERALQNAVEPLENMQRWGRRATIALAGLTAALGAGLVSAGRYAAEIRSASEQTGIAIETMQGLRFAAGETNVEITQLQAGLRGFVRRTVEAANGQTEFLKGFERLGFTQDEVRDGMEDIEELFLEVAERTSELGTAAEQSAVLMLLMSDAGRQMVPMFRDGRRGIEDFLAQARELGLVLDEDMILAFEQLDKTMGTTGDRIVRTGQAFTANFIGPALIVNDWVNRAIDLWQGLDDEQRQNIARWVAIGGVILAAVGILGALAGALRAIILTFRLVGLASLVGFAAPILANIALVAGIFLALREAWEADLFGLRTLIEETGLGQAIQRAFDEASIGEIALAGVVLSLVGAKLWLVGRALASWIAGLFGSFLGGAIVSLGILAALTLLAPDETREHFLSDIQAILGTDEPLTVRIASVLARVGEFFFEWMEQDPLSALAAALTGSFLIARVAGPGALAVTLGLTVGFRVQDIIFQNLFGPGVDEMARQAEDVETLTRQLFEGAGAFAFQTGKDVTSSVEAFADYIDTVAEASEEVANLRDEILRTAAELDLFNAPQQTILQRLGELLGFQSGGFTGSGPVDEVAGVVHRGEIVIPARAVSEGLPGILKFLGVPGFQEGAGEGFFSGLASSLIETLQSEQVRGVLGEERADQFVGFVRQAGDALAFLETEATRLFGAIGDFEGEIQDLIDEMERQQEQQEKQQQAEERQLAVTNLLNAAMANFPVIVSAVQGAAMGAALGPVGMVVGALLGLAQNSEVASQAFAVINELLGTLMQALAPLFEPLLAIANVLATALAPVFQVIGSILQTLIVPVFRALFPVIQLLGLAAVFVARVFEVVRRTFLEIMRSIVRAIDAIPFVNMSNELSRLNKAIKQSDQNFAELNEAERELINLTWEEATAIESATDAANSFASALQNAPRAFRVQTHRLAAQDPVPVMDTGGVVQGPGVFAVGAGVREIVRDPEGAVGDSINVTIVSNDPQTIWRKLEPLMQRNRARIAGSRFAVPGPASTG